MLKPFQYRLTSITPTEPSGTQILFGVVSRVVYERIFLRLSDTAKAWDFR